MEGQPTEAFLLCSGSLFQVALIQSTAQAGLCVFSEVLFTLSGNVPVTQVSADEPNYLGNKASPT